MTAEAEKRAREYAAKDRGTDVWTINKILDSRDDHPWKKRIEDVINTFLAGQQSQWRKYPEEKPEKNDCYICIVHQTTDSPEETFPEVVSWWNDSEWDLELHKVVCWAPINLPTSKNS